MPDALTDLVLPDARRPRERILSAARDLFHRHGIRRVGVEAIAEAAGTNKMTLYRHFCSKDELIVAYLRGVAADAEMMWRDLERKNPDDGQARLRSWIKLAAECLAADGRGCDLANAAVELTEDGHPARRLIEQLKIEQHRRLIALCKAAGIARPDVLADVLTLLFDGARVSRQAAGSKGPSAKFVRTAQMVIESFASKPAARPGHEKVRRTSTRRSPGAVVSY
jgi:AcrR family transcriptional regulator